jgi:hypothetical protein
VNTMNRPDGLPWWAEVRRRAGARVGATQAVGGRSSRTRPVAKILRVAAHVGPFSRNGREGPPIEQLLRVTELHRGEAVLAPFP